MVDAGGGLPLPEDRLLTIMEAAQVLVAYIPSPEINPAIMEAAQAPVV